jgi:hypothetical protein
MLRVRLEACTPRPTLLGELHIRNDGSGDGRIASYDVRLVSDPDSPASTVRAARVEQYPRDMGAWQLVQCALLALNMPRRRHDDV